MPRFTEEVQNRVDAEHADAAIAMESAQALFGVPPEARLAMPMQLDSGKLFFKKSKFLTQYECSAFLNGGGDYNLRLHKFREKIERCFGFDPAIWEWTNLKTSTPNSEVACYNCAHTTKPAGWHWNRDRQISVIVWLENSDDILEFPYLKPTAESEPPVIQAKKGQMLVFPSNPLYAFKVIGNKEVKFLECHATRTEIEKPDPSLK